MINNKIEDHLTDQDKNEIENKMKIWYGSNHRTFLDFTISKYHGESTMIQQSCVPTIGDKWSILDINVISDTTLLKNGYVQKN